MTRGYAMPQPNASWRFLMSPGLTPEEVMRMRTSPAPGTGSGISPTISTSRAGPCLSYQAALICKLPSFEVSQAATLLVREFFANTGWDSICNGGGLPGNRLFRRLAEATNAGLVGCVSSHHAAISSSVVTKLHSITTGRNERRHRRTGCDL